MAISKRTFESFKIKAFTYAYGSMVRLVSHKQQRIWIEPSKKDHIYPTESAQLRKRSGNLSITSFRVNSTTELKI